MPWFGGRGWADCTVDKADAAATERGGSGVGHATCERGAQRKTEGAWMCGVHGWWHGFERFERNVMCVYGTLRPYNCGQ